MLKKTESRKDVHIDAECKDICQRQTDSWVTNHKLDSGVHLCLRQLVSSACFPEDLLAWIFYGAEILLYLVATVRGSSFGRQSSSGPERSGNTRWTACRPPQGTPTSGQACRSRRRVPCEFLANLPRENLRVSIDSGTLKLMLPPIEYADIVNQNTPDTILKPLTVLFNSSCRFEHIFVLCLIHWTGCNPNQDGNFTGFTSSWKEFTSAVFHIWIQILYGHSNISGAIQEQSYVAWVPQEAKLYF